MINWTKFVNNIAVNAATDERLQIVNQDMSETSLRTQLIVTNVSESDNGTYVCHAKNDYNNQSEAHLTLIVVQKASIALEKAQPLNARSLQLWWRVVTDGNDSINRFILEMKNYSSEVSHDWTRIENNIEPNYSGSHIVQYLAPAVTYGFQLAAINGAGLTSLALLSSLFSLTTDTIISSSFYYHFIHLTNALILFLLSNICLNYVFVI